MKHMRRFTALVLALVMVFSLTVSASAADTPKPEQVTAYLNYNLTIRFNGEAKLLGNVNGNQVYPITYGGTTYVPVRAISNLLGLDVTWLQEHRIVRLSDANDTEPITVKPDTPKKSGLETIRPTIDPGITVIYNGKEQEMKTVKGETVYPMLNGGTTYLPIRAVGDTTSTTPTAPLSISTVPIIGATGGPATKPTISGLTRWSRWCFWNSIAWSAI